MLLSYCPKIGFFNMFTPEITTQLHYYVYRLIDPRNGQTFYIGKGIGNRIFAHAKGEVQHNDDVMSEKILRIREIRLANFEVGHVIHRHGMDEKTAFEVEAALIDAYPEVMNAQSGHDCDERGIMHANQIIERYQAQEIEFYHKLVMLNIGRSATENISVYESVRYAWPLDKNKIKKVEFVLAMRQGLVVGVFVPHRWLEATKENFPDREPYDRRLGFIGSEAPEDIQRLYLRKRFPDSLRKRGNANPVRYWL
jgi:uncharacterized protein